MYEIIHSSLIIPLYISHIYRLSAADQITHLVILGNSDTNTVRSINSHIITSTLYWQLPTTYIRISINDQSNQIVNTNPTCPLFTFLEKQLIDSHLRFSHYFTNSNRHYQEFYQIFQLQNHSSVISLPLINLFRMVLSHT